METHSFPHNTEDVENKIRELEEGIIAAERSNSGHRGAITQAKTAILINKEAIDFSKAEIKRLKDILQQQDGGAVQKKKQPSKARRFRAWVDLY
jgi:hypothetical protein